jgi:hypothetical protein
MKETNVIDLQISAENRVEEPLYNWEPLFVSPPADDPNGVCVLLLASTDIRLGTTGLQAGRAEATTVRLRLDVAGAQHLRDALAKAFRTSDTLRRQNQKAN